MPDELLVSISLLWPFLAAILLLAVSTLPTRYLQYINVFEIQVFGFLSVSRSPGTILARIVLAATATAALFYPAVRDYTPFFPQKYTMEVFFDDEGIENALRQLNSEEMRHFLIKQNWRVHKQTFWKKVNSQLREKIGDKFRFDFEHGIVHSKGETTLFVRKIKRWGLQRYNIYEAKGSLLHVLEQPGHEPKYLQSTFELLDIDMRNIEGTMKEVYLTHQMIITPEFKQTFRETQFSPQLFYYRVTAITKIRFFPFVDIGRTIYLIESPDGKRTPVAYAVYGLN